MLSFERIVNEIKKRGGPQIPALFIEIAEITARKKCFLPGGMERTVHRIEQRILKEMEGINTITPKEKVVDLHCGKCFCHFTLTEDNIHRRCGLRGCDGVLHKTS